MDGMMDFPMDSESDGSEVETDTEEYSSLDRTLEVSRSPSQAELLPELECPVCFDLPLPPIRTCVQGHIICAECCCKLVKCPLCQQRIDIGRNFFAENFLNMSLIKCKFRVDGCPMEARGEGMRAHMQGCEYRPLRCKRCSTRVAFSDFEAHMLTEHGIGRWDINDQGVRIVLSHKHRNRSRRSSAMDENFVPLKFILSILLITAVITAMIDSWYNFDEGDVNTTTTTAAEEKDQDSGYDRLINPLDWIFPVKGKVLNSVGSIWPGLFVN